MPAARKRKLGHPFLRDRPVGIWQPDAVGIVPLYPATQEAYDAKQARNRAQAIRLNAEGKMNRRGVPDGFKGKKDKVAAARARAHTKAKRIYRKMVELDMIDVPEIPTEDDKRAELVLIEMVSVAIDKTQNIRERLIAGKTVLDFTKVKPVAKSQVTVNTAEDFLTSLLTK